MNWVVQILLAQLVLTLCMQLIIFIFYKVTSKATNISSK